VKWERTVTVIGCHVGGEDNHVIVGGVLPPPGATMFEKKRYLETQADELRRWLLLEPRGKPALCINLVTPPTRPDCDAGLIIMESTDYPPMSGSNTICTVTVLLETGMLPMREPVTTLILDTPAGPVPVEARCRDGKVERVTGTQSGRRVGQESHRGAEVGASDGQDDECRRDQDLERRGCRYAIGCAEGRGSLLDREG